VLSLAGLLMVKGFRSLSQVELYSLVVLASLWLCDLGFNLTAAATVMRYEIFILMAEVGMILWLIERTFGRINNEAI